MNKFVKFNADCGEFKKGDVVEMDEKTAEALCKAGITAEQEKPEENEEDVEDKIEKALEARDNKLISTITKAMASEIKVKMPATAKSHDDESFGDFLQCIGRMGSNNASGEMKTKAHNKLRDAYKSTMSEGSNADGGYTVPVEYAKELLYVPGYDTAIWDKIKKRPMGSKTQILPALNQTISPSAGQSAFYGGVTIGFNAEGIAPANNTQPEFLQVALVANKLLATTVVSNELLDDSIISIQELIKDLFVQATNWYLDWNVLSGGASNGQFTGIVNHAATVVVHRSTAGEVLLQDLAKMYASLTPRSRKNAIWLFNPIVWQQLIMLGSVGGAAAHYVWLGNDAQGGLGAKLFGLEMRPTEILPTLGTSGDAMLVDPAYFACGVRQEMQIDSSPHYLFPADQIVYRLKMRACGLPQITAPIDLEGGGVVSPFVQLAGVSS